ncbi:hypothetical protein V5O48_003999 [Marasmius crinis-equi]|uniref:Aldehyde dehydrogenase domain-containing protein n=1 Tax=Marasmius crinis-equi TaxID=585013 RepID=A0ABR3FRP0_9AGAR
MSYLNSGIEQGAPLHLGGDYHGQESYYINPIIFTNAKRDMMIAQREIVSPVGVVIKFEYEDGVICQANGTVDGLAAAVFIQDINCVVNTAHRLKAGIAWVSVSRRYPIGRRRD